MSHAWPPLITGCGFVSYCTERLVQNCIRERYKKKFCKDSAKSRWEINYTIRENWKMIPLNIYSMRFQKLWSHCFLWYSSLRVENLCTACHNFIGCSTALLYVRIRLSLFCMDIRITQIYKIYIYVYILVTICQKQISSEPLKGT
jgi:hypothetical protein